MTLETTSLPENLATAHAMILAERAARLGAEARARDAEAEMSSTRLEIERLRLLLAKARRERFGQSSERGARLIEQLELQLAELEEGVAEDGAAAEIAAPVMEPAARPPSVRKPARRPLPENLPRERIVYPAPCACPKCGGPVRRPGEDVAESLECEPRRWKVVEHVREKVSCRSCEAISQPPAPSHPIARGRAGPSLLALVLAAKYGQHLPLTRQSAIYAREGVEIDVSTLAALRRRRISRVTADGSVLQRPPLCPWSRRSAPTSSRPCGCTVTTPRCRCWPRSGPGSAGPRASVDARSCADGSTALPSMGHVRDDRPFAGPDPPAVAFFYAPDREGIHPERHLAGFAGILQADAYGGFNRLYEPGRKPGPILEAACRAHARRKLYELAALGKAPIAAEAVWRIDRLFAVERDIAGLSAEARLAVRRERSPPILVELEPWLRRQQERLSRKSEVGKAIAYTTRHWEALTRFMGDGRICLSNNAAERALRGGECQEFRAVGMTGKGRRPWHVTTQSALDPGRVAGPAARRT